MANPKSVKVGYAFVDGAHFFVGKDMHTLGLCVAHTDMKTAFSEASQVLAKLYLLNHGVKKKFYFQDSFEDFAKWAMAINSPSTSKIKVQKVFSDISFEMAEAA